MSTKRPNLIFAIPNDHLDKKRVVLGDTNGQPELDLVSEKLDGDPLGQTSEDTLADYKKLKMMNHRTVALGITNAGALDPSGTDSTPRYIAGRAWLVTRRKKRNHPGKPW